MAGPNDNWSVFANRLSRRSLVAGSGAIVLLAAGCSGETTSGDVLPDYLGTPTSFDRVPGEPDRWAGRTLRIAAFGGQVEEALRTTLWDPFARHTGCTVEPVFASFASVATPMATERDLALTTAIAADVALADPITARAAATNGELLALPSDVVPNTAIGRIDDALTAPAFAYALVNARRRDAYPEASAPTSWADWWDAGGFPGGRALGRSAVGTLEVALLADGVRAAELYPLDLPRAFAALDRVVASVGDRWWSLGLEPVGWLGSGRAELATAWHHRVVAGQWDGLAVDLSWQSALLVVDQWVVPANAREPEIAADLIRFALTPERQAALARETRLGPVIPAAMQWIEPWLLPTIPTAPPHREQLVALDPVWWASEAEGVRTEFEQWFNETMM